MKKRALITKRLEFLGLLFIIYVLPSLFSYIAEIMKLNHKFKFNASGTFLFFALVLLFFYVKFKDKLEESKAGKDKLWYLGFSFMFFVMYFLVMYVYTLNTTFASYVFVAYALYAAGIIFLLLTIVGIRFFKEHWKTMVAILILVLVFFQLGLYLRSNWWYFGSTIVKSSYLMLSLLGKGNYTLEGIDPGLSFEGFSVRIGSPCSGIDSLSLFFVIFFLIIVLDWERFKVEKRKQIWWILILGMGGMFLVSIIRVMALMFVGARFSEELALGMFHTNAGWILFVIYVLLFWYKVYGWLRK